MEVVYGALNSGSNGNAYIIAAAGSAILVDAGLPLATMEKRIEKLGLHLSMVKALFISHEHGDHVTGLAGASRKYGMPVYLSRGTYNALPAGLKPAQPYWLEAHQSIPIGPFTITSFPKQHDGAEPYSFIVTTGSFTLGVFTDIGEPCTALQQYLGRCQALFLEANYCEHLLAQSKYPAFLKQRISGAQGHLSNQQALQLLQQYRGTQLAHVVLAHLSANNNTHTRALEAFAPISGSVKVEVASRYGVCGPFKALAG
ncbi:MAG TPA: MBL fold metallo-hydrolase [Phnomibacter sp.]|nr:MBL fold metallo-hydrolase [Phnomibacter sp.]